MPATTQDYSKIKEYQEATAAKNYEAAGMAATATTLPDEIMNAVREDRQTRGVSKLATDVGNTMAYQVSDPQRILGMEEQGLMKASSVTRLLESARVENQRMLGVEATQLEQNQGSLDQVIQAGANQLRARAQQMLAEAEKAEQQANTLKQQRDYEESVRQFNEQMQLGWYNAQNTGGGGGLSDVENAQLAAMNIMSGTMSLQDVPQSDRTLVSSFLGQLGYNPAQEISTYAEEAANKLKMIQDLQGYINKEGTQTGPGLGTWTGLTGQWASDADKAQAFGSMATLKAKEFFTVGGKALTESERKLLEPTAAGWNFGEALNISNLDKMYREARSAMKRQLKDIATDKKIYVTDAQIDAIINDELNKLGQRYTVTKVED